jgi:hypothetical protein
MLTATVTDPVEVVISRAGKVDPRSHAYDGNPAGRTACGLYPDKLTSRRAWRVVPFVRCAYCEAVYP